MEKGHGGRAGSSGVAKPLKDRFAEDLVHSAGSPENVGDVAGLQHVSVTGVDALSGQIACSLEARGLRTVRLGQ
eukprot:8962058-Alexandrium_andersonii.AAC.1